MATAQWSFADRISMYRKSVGALGIRGFLDRRNANHHGNSWVRTPWSDHPLFVRKGTSDLLVFDQIFVDREYRCIDHLRNVRLIIDAGANVGYSSAYLLSRFPESRVIALEPDPQNFAALKHNLAPWSDRVTTIQAALWSHQTTLDFRIETMGAGEEWGRQVEERPGKVKALDIPSVTGEPIDLLKVDIEGAEKVVFKSAPWLDRVRNMVVELHSDDDRSVFHSAIRDRRYTVSRCEELTVCVSHPNTE